MPNQEKQTLTIDVGNSFTKLAVFSNSKQVSFSKLENLKVGQLKDIIEVRSIDRIGYCASGKDDDEIIEYINSFPNSIVLDNHTSIPVKVMYDTPETLGRDRIAIVCGANSLFPQNNVVIINLGTCITYDLLDCMGNYHGGNIAPGVYMRLRAMHDYTAGLPMVEIVKTQSWIGKTTDEALINGAVLGTQMEIESFIGRTNKFFEGQQDTKNELKVVFTGGDAGIIYPYFNRKNILLEPYLLHIGLLEILNFNE